MTAADPLSLISSALAPAVALSACAILVSNAQSQYGSLVDRIRDLNAERRRIQDAPEVPTGRVERLRSVELQLPVLYRRAKVLRTAMVLLFGAMMAILTTSFMIVAGATLRWEVLPYVTKWCFFGGLVTVFAALAALMLEVTLTFRIVRYELGVSENQDYR